MSLPLRLNLKTKYTDFVRQKEKIIYLYTIKAITTTYQTLLMERLR